jgi:hypothetical protein
MKRLLSPILLSSLLLAGCGGPRFDATSEATAKASMERMSSGMSTAEKEEFGKDVMTVVMGDAMQTALSSMANAVQLPKGEIAKPASTLMFTSINGLTRAEIHAKAEQVRKEFAAKAAR